MRTLSFLLFLAPSLAFAAKIQPGFDRNEYKELMYVSARTGGDESYYKNIPSPSNFALEYRSQPIGLDNLWELWTDKKGQAVLSIRGTTLKQESWLENFYAAMVPANGTLQLDSLTSFPYSLAQDERAAVHVGWLVGMAFIYRDMEPKLDSLKKAGVQDILIIGHSQGGGISFLLTAYLRQKEKEALHSGDLRIKTYCSAAPKPGNLYFAYEYESLTQNGWAYNVVNAYDWVPEVPISIQTLNDFNTVNPFRHAEAMINSQSFAKRLIFKRIFNKLNKPTKAAQENYQKYLGDMAQKLVNGQLPHLQTPDYMASNNYVRTGISVVLNPTPEYKELYPNDSSKIFIHHLHEPYLYLTDNLKNPFWMNSEQGLAGDWKLAQLKDTVLDIAKLYPDKVPQIHFDLSRSTLSGHGSCNAFNAAFTMQDNSLSIAENAVRTLMACPQAEDYFFAKLSQANSWMRKGEELWLFRDAHLLMVLKRP